MMRAVLVGAGLALIAVAVGVALVVSGVVDLGVASEAPQRLLVIGAAPDDDGAEVAAFAFVLERDSDSALVLDTMQNATVPGTSAKNALEAFPFAGGSGVAEALAAQTDGEALPWVVLPAEMWGELVDGVGGVRVIVPQDVSVYQGDSLVVLEAGEKKLSGAETAALLRAVGYLDKRDSRTQVVREISSALSAVVSADRDSLATAVDGADGRSSLTKQQLAEFSAGQQ